MQVFIFSFFKHLSNLVQEWQVFSDAIEKANNEGIPEHMESALGLLTQVSDARLDHCV